MDRGGWGARTGHGMQVTLHVYDLSEVNEWAQHIGLGLYHTGVVIGMKEYTFAGGAGVFDHTPREPGDQAKFRESIAMGFFEGGQPQLHEALSALSKQFRPDAYSIVGNNCNHFADALCRRLVQQPIPGHINRLANFGGCFTACIPQQLLAGPPVGEFKGGGALSQTAAGDLMGAQLAGAAVHGPVVFLVVSFHLCRGDLAGFAPPHFPRRTGFRQPSRAVELPGVHWFRYDPRCEQRRSVDLIAAWERKPIRPARAHAAGQARAARR